MYYRLVIALHTVCGSMLTPDISRLTCLKEDLKKPRQYARKLCEAIEAFRKSLNVQKHVFYFRHVLEWLDNMNVRTRSSFTQHIILMGHGYSTSIVSIIKLFTNIRRMIYEKIGLILRKEWLLL